MVHEAENLTAPRREEPAQRIVVQVRRGPKRTRNGWPRFPLRHASRSKPRGFRWVLLLLACPLWLDHCRGTNTKALVQRRRSSTCAFGRLMPCASCLWTRGVRGTGALLQIRSVDQALRTAIIQTAQTAGQYMKWSVFGKQSSCESMGFSPVVWWWHSVGTMWNIWLLQQMPKLSVFVVTPCMIWLFWCPPNIVSIKAGNPTLFLYYIRINVLPFPFDHGISWHVGCSVTVSTRKNNPKLQLSYQLMYVYSVQHVSQIFSVLYGLLYVLLSNESEEGCIPDPTNE